MHKKIITIIILTCFLATTLGVGLLSPRPAKAFFPPVMLTQEMFSVPSTLERIWNVVKDALKIAGDIAYKNALKYFLNKLAVDTATHLATGSPGQKPLFITDGWNAYFKQIGDEALGDSFVKVGEMWGKNLCEPLEPLVKIELTVAAKRAFEVKKPRCTWSTIRKNITDLRDLKLDELVEFSSHFQPGASDLSAYLTIRTETKLDKTIKEEQEKLIRQIEGEFKSLTSPISGQIKTPAWLIKTTTGQIWPESIRPYMTYTGTAIADAIGIFTNTLASKYLEKVFKKGFNPQGDQVVVSDFWTLGGIAAARLFFGDLAEPSYSFDVGVRLTDELTIKGEEQFNQVIDDKFSRAIEEKCTLGQATGYYKLGDDAYRPECAGLVSGTAYFGYDEDGQEVSLSYGLPYRSILVLRKFRIAPVGWELAAEYYLNYEVKQGGEVKKLNLDRLVALYDKQYLDEAKTPNPYYKLVDPDWLLKAPATRCVREGAGPQKIEQDSYCASPEPDGSCASENVVYPFQRLDYCADYQTCLAEKADGSCDTNEWGYCLAEKPIWQIDGTECKKKYYATCETLSQAGTNQQVSYLLNTLSGYTDGVCDSGNAGCREYCNDFNPDTENWACAFDDGGVNSNGEINRKYLTSQSKECNEKDQGCHLFFSSLNKDRDEVETALANGASDPNAYGLLKENYVKLAPLYYGCEGYATPVAGVTKKDDCTGDNFWRDDLRICVVSGTKECEDFVKHCGANDVSCKLYTPVSTKDPAVPAVINTRICPDTNPDCADETDPNITWNDQCPASCVGYKTYRQMETPFESGVDEDFIANTAKTCSQPGCDQFTNLDEVARGGEGIEYYSYLRKCIKPEESGWSTYYTWEGSDTTGYQLKKWDLLEGDVILFDQGESSLGPAGEWCSNLTDKDCREFFDRNLESHKRYYSTTIVISDDCHPFRRTIANESNCVEPYGHWQTAGWCLYDAIPSESIKCSANNAGCREYKSNAGYNYQKIIQSYFKRADLEGWNSAGDTSVEISNESVRRGDYSLKVVHGAFGTIEHELTTGDLEEGKIYTLEFLAKGMGTISASFTGGDTPISSNSTLALTEEWDFYRLRLPVPSPIREFGLTEAETNNTKIQITGGTNFYLDNIVLKKMQSLLLIKNLWTTPNECLGPAPLPGNPGADMTGCESYRDSENKNINLRNFDHLCFEDVVGCELVIDSKNSSVLSDDDLNYLVLDKKFVCKENAKGCTRLGLITPDRDLDAATGNLVYTFEDKYKIVDPDKDFEQLCQANQVFCQTYTDKDGAPYYFRDPLARTCEYKKVDDEYGWYKSGSSVSCRGADEYTPLPTTPDPTYIYIKHCVGGVSLRDDKTCKADTDCTNLTNPNSTGLCVDWVGMCEDSSSGCREYQDPQEPEECNKKCVNYEHLYTSPPADSDCLNEDKICNHYYYKDVEECSGGVKPGQGCVGFNQTDNSDKDVRSYKVCESRTDITCDEDSDCPIDLTTGRQLKCVYTNQ